MRFAHKYQGSSFAELLEVEYSHLRPDFSRFAAGAFDPSSIPHGTTVLAFKYADGVMVAGDRLATEGYRVASRDVQKVFPTDAHSLIAIAGAAGPCIEMARLMRIELEHYEKIEGEPIALFVPHASYIYSGWVAAYAYRQIEGLDYDTVVVIGDTHTGGGTAPIAVWARGTYETPLGTVPVDEEVAAALLAADSRILFDRAGHESEHPVENQIPFLQRVLSSDFKVVPIVLHDDSLEIAQVLSQALV